MITKADKTYSKVSGHTLDNTTEVNLFPLMYDTAYNEYFFNIFRAYMINEAVLNNILYYTTHEVSDSDWLDTIAHKYYEISGLWWVIALFNGINNPFEELIPGTNLKILRPQYLYKLLSEIKMIAGL